MAGCLCSTLRCPLSPPRKLFRGFWALQVRLVAPNHTPLWSTPQSPASRSPCQALRHSKTLACTKARIKVSPIALRHSQLSIYPDKSEATPMKTSSILTDLQLANLRVSGHHRHGVDHLTEILPPKEDKGRIAPLSSSAFVFL